MGSRFFRYAVLGLASCLVGRPASADTAAPPERPALPRGARVRLNVAGETTPFVGRVVSTDSGGILIDPEGSAEARLVRWDDLNEASRPRLSRWRGFGSALLTGAIGGIVLSAGEPDEAPAYAVAGAVFSIPGAVLGAAASGPHRTRTGATNGALVGALVFGSLAFVGCAIGEAIGDGPSEDGQAGCLAYGALIGAGIGAAAGGAAAHFTRESWEPVWTRGVSVGVRPVRGRGAAVEVRVSWGSR